MTSCNRRDTLCVCNLYLGMSAENRGIHIGGPKRTKPGIRDRKKGQRMKNTRKYETRSFELDPFDGMMPTALIQYLQETAHHQIHDMDKDYDLIVTEDRKAFVVSRMSVEIYRPIHKYAHIECDTWVTEGKAANFPRMYEMKLDGELVARAASNWALVDVDTKKLVMQGEYDLSTYPFGEEPELHIPRRFRIPKDVELTECRKMPVTYSLTDINGHMNNALYYNCLVDSLPEAADYFISSMNVRFVHEAPLGSELIIRRSALMESGKLDPNADAVVCFRTEVNRAVMDETEIAGEENIQAVFGLQRRK